MTALPSRPNKHAVEMQRLDVRLQIWLKAIHGLNIVGAILATALPLLLLKGCIEPLAGEETIVNANIVFSVSIALSVIVNGAQYVKGASRKRRLKELRARVEDLEERLGIVGGTG